MIAVLHYNTEGYPAVVIDGGGTYSIDDGDKIYALRKPRRMRFPIGIDSEPTPEYFDPEIKRKVYFKDRHHFNILWDKANRKISRLWSQVRV